MSPTISIINSHCIPNMELETDEQILKRQKIFAALLWNSGRKDLQSMNPIPFGHKKPDAFTILFIGLVFLVLLAVSFEGIQTWSQRTCQQPQEKGWGNTSSFVRNNIEASRILREANHELKQDTQITQMIEPPRKSRQYLAMSSLNGGKYNNQKGRDDFLTGERTLPKYHAYPYTIITASSANHYCPLGNFLISVRNASSYLPLSERPRVIVYDIGLNETQRSHFERTWIHTEDRMVHSIRTFNWSAYPLHYSLSAARAGHWAWKPAIVKEVADEYGGIVVWMDAGDEVSTSFLENVKELVKTKPSPGFWSPVSSGSVQKWVHKGLPTFFGDGLTSTFTRMRNCNGAIAIFNTDDPHILNNIIRPWAACALTKHCIAPPGSNRSNHRQDQAVLTYLVHRAGLRCVDGAGDYKLKVHMDKICRKEASSVAIIAQ